MRKTAIGIGVVGLLLSVVGGLYCFILFTNATELKWKLVVAGCTIVVFFAGCGLLNWASKLYTKGKKD